MKQLKRPTREEKKLMERWGLNPRDWLVERNTPEAMRIVHRYSGKTVREIPKG